MVRIFSERLAQWDCAMKAMLGAGTGAVRMDHDESDIGQQLFRFRVARDAGLFAGRCSPVFVIELFEYFYQSRRQFFGDVRAKAFMQQFADGVSDLLIKSPFPMFRHDRMQV